MDGSTRQMWVKLLKVGNLFQKILQFVKKKGEIILKFEQYGFTIDYSLYPKDEDGMANSVGMGLHCLPRPVCRKLRITTVVIVILAEPHDS